MPTTPARDPAPRFGLGRPSDAADAAIPTDAAGRARRAFPPDPPLPSGGESWTGPTRHTLRAPALVSLLWCLCLLALYHWTMHRENEYVTELARLQTGTFYSSIVAVRAWNAWHGGVWVEAGEQYPANPWVAEGRRSLVTTDGRTLALVNPAYMTRQIADFSTPALAAFRIVGLTPMRPGNLADSWEADALRSFAAGGGEAFSLTRAPNDADGARYRYMAPLTAEASCLSCHHNAAAGDLLGGISVSIAAGPFLDAAAERKRTTGIAYSCIALLGIVGIGGATLQINRKKEQAEAANRMKSAFLANMSHDMRTPLTGILGMTELLENDAADPAQRRLLAHLHDATGSLLEVVDGIMRYALLEAEGHSRRGAPFSLRTELEACLKAVRPTCESKGVALIPVIDPDLPDALFGEGFRLRQALGNLLGNAVKFTDRGSVTLRADCPERNSTAGLMRFRVIDTGTGVPPEERGRIFDSFVQGEATPHTGVGLGLSIARNIARRLGGDVTLRSVVGKGSEFTLTARFRIVPDALAVQDSPPAPGAPSSGSFEPDPAAASDPFGPPGPHDPTAPPDSGDPDDSGSLPLPACPGLAGCRIVAAEDTPIASLFLQEALTRAGAEIHMAADAAGALALIREVKPDLLLLDVRMPDGTGLSVAATVRRGEAGVPADLPILLLSASISAEQEAEAARLGVSGRLLKPVRAEDLARAISSLLSLQPRPDPAPADKPDPVFDAAGALDDMDGDAPLLCRLCLLFLEEAPAERAALVASIEAPPAGAEDSRARRAAAMTLLRRAHRLKNSAATLRLSSLQQACAELEAAARNAVATAAGTTDAADQAGVRPALLLVLDALDPACAALRDFCRIG